MGNRLHLVAPSVNEKGQAALILRLDGRECHSGDRASGQALTFANTGVISGGPEYRVYRLRFVACRAPIGD
jgi:hypothetical protein